MAAPKKRKTTRAAAGYVRKLPSGRYQASHVLDGVRYSIGTFDAKVDADAQLRRRLVAAETGAWSPDIVEQRAAEKRAAAVTLAEYFETWLGVKDRRPRTVAEYRRLLVGSLKDLATLPLSSITPEIVDQWWTAAKAGGKITQASRAYSLLSTILGHAVTRDRIASNPCRVDGAQSVRTGKKVIPPTDEQFAAIVAAIPDRFKALIYLAADGGLRWGEATELRRNDVTLDRDDDGVLVRVLVTIARAVVKVKGEFVAGPTKTAAGVRAVYVYGDAADAIARHLDEHVIRFGSPLLFPALGDDTGTRHLSQSTFHTPTWNDARTAAGRPDMPFHALRHYAGTRYAQHGATLAETMSRLGHSSVTVAMRYQHATDRDAEIAARMASRGTSA